MREITGNSRNSQFPNRDLGHPQQDSTSSQKSTPDATGTKAPNGRGWNGGGCIRDIRKSFEVNPNSGTFDFTVPIDTSATRSNDVSPNLSLAYSSGSGNGPFGIGWKVPLGGIYRRTSKNIPLYTREDIFVLNDSDDLIPFALPATTMTADGVTFLVQKFILRFTHANMRVERWSNQSLTSDVWWKVISATNITTIYGRTEESQIFEDAGTRDPDDRRIFAWLPSLVYDGKGNAMKYTYKRDDSEGLKSVDPSLLLCEKGRDDNTRSRARYLKSIQYGNRKPNRDLSSWDIIETPVADWLYEVIFDYGEHDEESPTSKEVRKWPMRSDPFSTYTSGFEIRQYRLCHRILMFHHMPEKLNGRDTLVGSTELKYDHREACSTLRTITTAGYDMLSTPGMPVRETQADLKFSYSQSPAANSVELQTFRSASIQSLPGAERGTVAQWVDLDGEGVPGLLSEYLNGELWYQRNVSGLWVAAGLTDPLPVPNQPTKGNKLARSFTDLDHNGKLDVFFADVNGNPVGYVERKGEEWTNFTPFSCSLGLAMRSTQLTQLDVTGDGLVDVVTQDQDNSTLTWHKSLGKDGFDRAKSAALADAHFTLLHQYPISTIMFADMSGDGLQDVVRVSNGRISYWPNMGYGNFGTEIVMNNSPTFAPADEFDPSRLKFADIDGYGPTDIIYLPRSGGVRVYNNLSGNGWSDSSTIEVIPYVDNLSSVSLVDIFGTGTACLCWTGLGYHEQLSGQTVRYLDFMGSQKPHVLTQITNNCGTKISVTYKSSTFFCRQDERRGRLTTSTLPFPVQCVHELTVKEEITGTLSQTTYAYHDGSYDGVAREFAGFGAVDELKVESFGPGFSHPGTRIRRWYYNDMLQPRNELVEAYKPQLLMGSALSSTLQANETRAFYRALRGKLLREETFAYDGSAVQGIPYVTKEWAYQVNLVQPQGSRLYCSTRVSDLESLTCIYERQQQDARYGHELVIAVNEYGQVLKSVTVNYGRAESTLTRDHDRSSQHQTNASYNEYFYTNAVDNADAYFEPQSAGEVCYILHGLTAVLNKPLTRADLYRQVIGIRAEGVEMQPDDAGLTPSIGHSFIRVKESRVLYRSSNLKDLLPFGQIDAFSVPERSYLLVSVQPNAESVWDLGRGSVTPTSLGPAFSDLGYIRLEGHSGWWQPQKAIRFSNDISEELTKARESFYTPQVEINALGRITTLHMDTYHLLMVAQTDPLGNTTKYENDYQTLKPSAIIDINGNITRKAYDTFGREIAVAYGGKVQERIGDPGHQYMLPATESDLLSFLSNPSSNARNLLGDWSRRTLIDQKSYANSGGQMPCWTATIERTRFQQDSPISITISYLDSKGSQIQRTRMSTDSQWLVDSRIIQDSQGATVRHFLPFYATNHHFIALGDHSLNLASTHIYDAMGREIALFKADTTWTKLVYRPWEHIVYDEGDLVVATDPALDNDVGSFCQLVERSVYFPGWLARKQSSTAFTTAELTAMQAHADTPTVKHLDALGRYICTVQDSGRLNSTSSTVFNVLGHPQIYYDPRDRIVESLSYDLLGHTIVRQSMDSGKYFAAYDVVGKLVATYNGTNVYQETVYDELERETQRWVTGETSNQSRRLVNRCVYGESRPQSTESNTRGRKVREEDQAGVSEFSDYDFRGHALRETRTLAKEYKSTLDWSEQVDLEDDVYETRKSYDALGRNVEIHNANGDAVEYTFSLLGTIRDITSTINNLGASPVKILEGAQYTATNKPLILLYGNNSKTLYTYDEASQTTIRQVTIGNRGEKLIDVQHKYDSFGRKIASIDSAAQATYFRNNKIMPHSTFSYDGLGRLLSATGREQVDPQSGLMRTRDASNNSNIGPGMLPGNGEAMCEYIEEYKYDESGNITQISHQPRVDLSIQGWTKQYLYEEISLLQSDQRNNRLSRTVISGSEQRYSYEGTSGASGCMTSMPGFSQMSWDFDNRLRSSATQIVADGTPETTYFRYDSTGRRIRKTTERADTTNVRRSRLRETLYLPSYEIFRRYSGDGISVTTEKKICRVENSKKIALLETLTSNRNAPRSLVRYQISPNIELDGEANVISHEEYSPFGASTYVACASDIDSPSSYRYASYERDVETGLFFVGQRYYVPWLGRWLSPDPVGIMDGFNVYAYTGNDPVNFEDQSGTGKTGATDGSGMDTATSNTPISNSVQSNNQSSTQHPIASTNWSQSVSSILSSPQLQPVVTSFQKLLNTAMQAGNEVKQSRDRWLANYHGPPNPTQLGADRAWQAFAGNMAVMTTAGLIVTHSAALAVVFRPGASGPLLAKTIKPFVRSIPPLKHIINTNLGVKPWGAAGIAIGAATWAFQPLIHRKFEERIGRFDSIGDLAALGVERARAGTLFSDLKQTFKNTRERYPGRRSL